jgi:UDP-2,3-diacylglucosamine hydrolase
VGAPRRLLEIPIDAGALVIADLHLDVSPSAAPHAAFAAWLRAQGDLPQLVVMGDLFDAWVGPAHARLPAAHEVCEALRERALMGARIEVLHGNRDFLLDERFERDTGARVHGDGFVGVLPGGRTRALFVHGDELCTLDLSYQRMKRVLRSGPVRWIAPRLPAAIALRAAASLRSTSRRAVPAKPAQQKEQQALAVRELARAHACSVLVCGHAHRFRDEQLDGGVRWIVLDAFGDGRDLLRIGADGGIVAVPSHSAAPAQAPAGPGAPQG